MRPAAVGICGSDFHYFLGEIGDQAVYPRIQGHEVGAVVEAVGPDCSRGLRAGDSVALHPLTHCGECYPCRIGRTNVCDNFSLIGIHEDGGFQEQLVLSEELVVRTKERRPQLAALAEPLSIAVRAINRSRLSGDEHAVIFGAGPIGQAICLLARERGASVLMIDPVASRLAIGERFGAETMAWTDDVVDAAREWSGGEGVGGRRSTPPARRTRSGPASRRRSRPDGSMMVGMSRPRRAAARVRVRRQGAGRARGQLLPRARSSPRRWRSSSATRTGSSGSITQEFPLERTPEALRWAMDHPAEAMKVVIGIRGGGRQDATPSS